MPFDDDSRWDEVIALMNYLSLKGYTGVLKFSFVKGRVHRRTVDDFRWVVALLKESQPAQQEPVHAEA